MSTSIQRTPANHHVTALSLGIWGAALFIAGVIRLDDPWALAAIVTGAVHLPLCLLAVLGKRWIVATYVALIANGGGLLAAGIGLHATAIIGVGLATIMLVAAAAPIATLLLQNAGPVNTEGTNVGSNANVLTMLQRIDEHSMLSDAAKRVLFRERELTMLRQTIEADVREGQLDAALKLCDDLAELFGRLEEAEGYRADILSRREQEHDQQLRKQLDEFDAHLTARNWKSAHLLMGRLSRLYPDSHGIEDLEDRFAAARDAAKMELEQAFLAAAQRDDVDEALAILRELDRSISKEEAARLREVAHGVLHKHKENLGLRFRVAVNDHQWEEAARAGQELIQEFPNSKMANEVRSLLDTIQTRATQSAIDSAN